MEISSKTTTDGFSLPLLGLGTYKMGGVLERDERNDDERDIAAIRRAIDAGVTHIDTAELYAAGKSEELIARALQGVDRSSITLVSKVMPEHLTYDGVLRAAEGSLRRLETDWLDLYLIHKTFPGQDVTEAMRAMNTLVDRGLVRSIGVSNFSVELLEKAQSVSKNRIVNNQVHFSLLVREIERTGLLSYCNRHDILLTAWRPVHLGHLASAGIPVIDEMCRNYSATPAQIALAWVMAHPGVVALCKMTSPQHLQENLGSLSIDLEPSDVERLRVEYPGQIDVSPSVPLCH